MPVFSFKIYWSYIFIGATFHKPYWIPWASGPCLIHLNFVYVFNLNVLENKTPYLKKTVKVFGEKHSGTST